jgi:mono/diheme cytochrome c family protein
MLTSKFNKSRIDLLQLRLIISVTFLLFATLASAQVKGGKWIAPKTADAVKNPVVPDAANLKEAKTMYTTYCMPCHGSKGKGDGVAAAGLAIKPADHTSTFIQNQTDGALFWEMSEGHNPMPSYKTALTEKQRWELINYIRTFAKK